MKILLALVLSLTSSVTAFARDCKVKSIRIEGTEGVRIDRKGDKDIVVLANTQVSPELRTEVARWILPGQMPKEQIDARVKSFLDEHIDELTVATAQLKYLQSRLSNQRPPRFIVTETISEDLESQVQLARDLYSAEWLHVHISSLPRDQWENLFLLLVGPAVALRIRQPDKFNSIRMAGINVQANALTKDTSEDTAEGGDEPEQTTDRTTESAQVSDLRRRLDSMEEELRNKYDKGGRDNSLRTFNRFRRELNRIPDRQSESEIKRRVLARFTREVHRDIGAWVDLKIRVLRAQQSGSANKSVKASSVKGKKTSAVERYSRSELNAISSGEGILLVPKAENIAAAAKSLAKTCQ